MDGGREAKFPEDCIGVFLPQPRGLQVALHGREDRDDMSRWDGRAAFVIFPPLMKSFVGLDVEALFWWRGFSKGIAYIRSKY
jgi:hypothetical protein